MKKITLSIMTAISLLMSGCASMDGLKFPTNKETTASVVKNAVVVSSEKVKKEESAINIANIAGALFGGIIGNQFGAGNGKTLATTGGALVGSAMASSLKKTDYDVHTVVAFVDGSMVEVVQSLEKTEVFRKGDFVQVSLDSDGNPIGIKFVEAKKNVQIVEKEKIVEKIKTIHDTKTKVVVKKVYTNNPTTTATVMNSQGSIISKQTIVGDQKLILRQE